MRRISDEVMFNQVIQRQHLMSTHTKDQRDRPIEIQSNGAGLGFERRWWAERELRGVDDAQSNKDLGQIDEKFIRS